MQPSKNAPCPCGSGKKYKRCCIGSRPVNDPFQFSNPYAKPSGDYSQLSGAYNSKDLLKVISVLQLLPQNHGKNVRFELVVTYVLNNVNHSMKETNFQSMIKDIIKYCIPNSLEDPPEEFFTENIVFTNGNNVVFPGIGTNAKETIQGFINALSARQYLPPLFVEKVRNGILFILSVHDSIAKKLGYGHRFFIEPQNDGIFSLPHEEIVDKIGLVSFNKKDFEQICHSLDIPYLAIEDFIIDPSESNITYSDLSEDPLLTKPFVYIDGEYILVLPTAELICLNEFIIGEAKKFGCYDMLMNFFAIDASETLRSVCIQMRYKPLKNNQSNEIIKYDSFLTSFSTWRFDQNKIAQVVLLVEYTSSVNDAKFNKLTENSILEKKIVENKQEIQNDYPNTQILTVVLIVKSRILAFIRLAFAHNNRIDHFISSGLYELEAIIQNYTFDRLTLWKYYKYHKLASKTMTFAPYTTHVAKYHWYHQNNESFYHPENEPANFLVLGFEVESEEKRKALLKIDKIGIPAILDEKLVVLRCARKEKYYPVYFSDEIQHGIIRKCLAKYTCPIWIISLQEGDLTADTYIDAILYWLNDFHQSILNYLNKFGLLPIHFVLELDSNYYNLSEQNFENHDDIEIKYEVDAQSRCIRFKLPFQLARLFRKFDNEGEKIMMSFLLDSIGDLMKSLSIGGRLLPNTKSVIIEKHMQPSNKKMVLLSITGRDLKLADIDLVDPREISNSDISYIMQNQVMWLGDKYVIPEDIADKTQKTKILKDLVDLHFGKLTTSIAEYDMISLLLYLMKRHESLLQLRTERKLKYPFAEMCYGEFSSILEEHSNSQSKLISACLGIRTLIEFVFVLKPKGEKEVNDDDVDLILAAVLEIISKGILIDSLNDSSFSVELQNPKMGLLKSGRIGINMDFNDNVLVPFAKEHNTETFYSYVEFSENFFNERTKDNTYSESKYIKDVEAVFKSEWGITPWDIYALCDFLCKWLYEKEKSVELVKLSELEDAVLKNTDFSKDEIEAFFNQMIFIDRDTILVSPAGYDIWDTYPWRYNRKLSYINRPIIEYEVDGVTHLFISARHLLTAAENLMSKFFDGTLKTDKVQIKKLLNERNNIKSKEFSNEVYEWLNVESSLTLIGRELRISKNGFFDAKLDMGDIDILVANTETKVLYSIECKNTSQAKIVYDFRRDLENYIGKGQKIQKHINRHEWLETNRNYVFDKLNLDIDYKIVSLVVTNNIIPLKYMNLTSMKIVSFMELKLKYVIL